MVLGRPLDITSITVLKRYGSLALCVLKEAFKPRLLSLGDRGELSGSWVLAITKLGVKFGKPSPETTKKWSVLFNNLSS